MRRSIRLYIGMAAIVLGVLSCGKSGGAQKEKSMTVPDTNIRPPVFAYQGWYDRDPDRLRRIIKRYLDDAEVVDGLGDVTGLISPHAGYTFSGPVAAHAFKQIGGAEYDTVVVIAPNHRDPRLTFSSVMVQGGYETPLGVVRVDEETAGAIASYDDNDNVIASMRGHLVGVPAEVEHSLEIQLPFLQYVLGDFVLVPIVMGDQSGESCNMLCRAVVEAVKGKKALLVASTDLSHFFDAERAEMLDGVVRDRVASFDPEGLLVDIDAHKCQACGGAPMVTVMMAARELGAKKAAVLNMAHSGDVTGENSSVVGYLAASFSAGEAGEKDGAEVGVNLGLSDAEKKVLKDVVSKTLESVVNGRSIPEFQDFRGRLGEHWGAFVTLNKNGRLRGCIGHIIGTQPLITTVAEMTRAAALEDPRFRAVQPSELSDIEFEISVLTPIREITDIDEIVVGRDGIIITRGYNRGLLLPQVATEYGWDRETFLDQTCNKAGLPADAWRRDGTKIEIFSAEIIH